MAPAALCGPALAEVDGVFFPQLTPNTQRRLMLPEGALQRTSLSCAQKPAARQEACQPGQAYASPSPSPSSCSAPTLVTPINAATTQWRTLRCPCAPGPSKACLHGSDETPFTAALTVWPSPTNSPLVCSPSPVAFGAPLAASPMGDLCTPSDVATTAWRLNECPFAPAPHRGRNPAASLEPSPLAAGSPLASSSPGTQASPVVGNPWASPTSDTHAVFVPFSRGLMARKVTKSTSELSTSSAVSGALAGRPRTLPGSTPMGGFIGTPVVRRIAEETAEPAPSTSSPSAAKVVLSRAAPFGLPSCQVPPASKPMAQGSRGGGPAAPREASCSHDGEGTPLWSHKLGA
mmetsp:Transcript_146843/g.381616  ORF Transcript_146843/g.381616 Transcript_146843/m.381616 type:complete len:347 (-) Transcript_146843:295-1335(-)